MNLYSERRKKLAASINGNFLLTVFSGKAPMRSQDEAYEFSIDRNFYYLSGLDKEDMVLLLSRIDGNYTEELFIQPYDEDMARWVGGRMKAEETVEISGVADVYELSDFDERLAQYLNRSRKDPEFTFYGDFWHYSADQPLTAVHKLSQKLHEQYPYLKQADLFPLMARMRLVKDEEELKQIRKAIHTTNLGIQTMLRSIKPGMNEMNMEAIFNFVLANALCRNTAFKTIAASGERATILHYSDNDQVMKDGELFLCDLGASSSYYNADISRTFPVNSHFSERQKELYQVVLNAQKLVIDNARPGVNIKDLNKLVVDYYKEELPKHGLDGEVSDYYYHSVSHHLGLDTHDVDGGLGLILQAGNVITDEPGLYIAQEGIGIRIEDDLLITEDGCEVLSQEIVKEIADIENYMNKG